MVGTTGDALVVDAFVNGARSVEVSAGGECARAVNLTDHLFARSEGVGLSAVGIAGNELAATVSGRLVVVVAIARVRAGVERETLTARGIAITAAGSTARSGGEETETRGDGNGVRGDEVLSAPVPDEVVRVAVGNGSHLIRKEDGIVSDGDDGDASSGSVSDGSLNGSVNGAIPTVSDDNNDPLTTGEGRELSGSSGDRESDVTETGTARDGGRARFTKTTDSRCNGGLRGTLSDGEELRNNIVILVETNVDSVFKVKIGDEVGDVGGEESGEGGLGHIGSVDSNDHVDGATADTAFGLVKESDESAVRGGDVLDVGEGHDASIIQDGTNNCLRSVVGDVEGRDGLLDPIIGVGNVLADFDLLTVDSESLNGVVGIVVSLGIGIGLVIRQLVEELSLVGANEGLLALLASRARTRGEEVLTIMVVGAGSLEGVELDGIRVFGVNDPGTVFPGVSEGAVNGTSGSSITRSDLNIGTEGNTSEGRRGRGEVAVSDTLNGTDVLERDALLTHRDGLRSVEVDNAGGGDGGTKVTSRRGVRDASKLDIKTNNHHLTGVEVGGGVGGLEDGALGEDGGSHPWE